MPDPLEFAPPWLRAPSEWTNDHSLALAARYRTISKRPLHAERPTGAHHHANENYVAISGDLYCNSDPPMTTLPIRSCGLAGPGDRIGRLRSGRGAAAEHHSLSLRQPRLRRHRPFRFHAAPHAEPRSDGARRNEAHAFLFRERRLLAGAGRAHDRLLSASA